MRRPALQGGLRRRRRRQELCSSLVDQQGPQVGLDGRQLRRNRLQQQCSRVERVFCCSSSPSHLALISASTSSNRLVLSLSAAPESLDRPRTRMPDERRLRRRLCYPWPLRTLLILDCCICSPLRDLSPHSQSSSTSSSYSSSFSSLKDPSLTSPHSSPLAKSGPASKSPHRPLLPTRSFTLLIPQSLSSPSLEMLQHTRRLDLSTTSAPSRVVHLSLAHVLQDACAASEPGRLSASDAHLPAFVYLKSSHPRRLALSCPTFQHPVRSAWIFPFDSQQAVLGCNTSARDPCTTSLARSIIFLQPAAKSAATSLLSSDQQNQRPSALSRV